MPHSMNSMVSVIMRMSFGFVDWFHCALSLSVSFIPLSVGRFIAC